jgi:hypothetical protein
MLNTRRLPAEILGKSIAQLYGCFFLVNSLGFVRRTLLLCLYV